MDAVWQLSVDSNRLAAHVSLTRSAHSGVLDSLEGPDCHKLSVSVRFTQPQKGVYRPWFLHSECPFHTRVQNSERPPHYSDDRVDKRLEEYDVDILEKCVFKLKPDE